MYSPSAFDTVELTADRSGAPVSEPRTPWSPVPGDVSRGASSTLRNPMS